MSSSIAWNYTLFHYGNTVAIKIQPQHLMREVAVKIQKRGMATWWAACLTSATTITTASMATTTSTTMPGLLE